jgi:hypothetical protein
MGSMKMKSRDNFEKAKKTFQSSGGVPRMNQALQAGIHRRMLYSMLEAGVIEKEGIQGEKRICGAPRKWAVQWLVMSIWHALRKRPGANCRRENQDGNRRIP